MYRKVQTKTTKTTIYYYSPWLYFYCYLSVFIFSSRTLTMYNLFISSPIHLTLPQYLYHGHFTPATLFIAWSLTCNIIYMVTLQCITYISCIPCSIVYITVTYFCNIFISWSLTWQYFLYHATFYSQYLLLHIVCCRLFVFLFYCVGYKIFMSVCCVSALSTF